MTYRNIIEDWYKEHQGNISLEDLQNFINHIGAMIADEFSTEIRRTLRDFEDDLSERN